MDLEGIVSYPTIAIHSSLVEKTMAKYDSVTPENSRSSVNALGWTQLIESFQKQRFLKDATSENSDMRHYPKTERISPPRVGECFFDAGMEALSKAEARKIIERESFCDPSTSLSSIAEEWEQLALDVTARLTDDCFASDGWRSLDHDPISLSTSEPDFSLELGLLESVESISRDIAQTMGIGTPNMPLPVVSSHGSFTVAE